jgi:XTP/dITP diphosphohydrolase
MIYFVTSNQQKIKRIQPTLTSFGIETQTKNLNLQEIQSDSIEEIATYKAKDAFKKLNLPLFVVDDGWFITALNGFPGAYMKMAKASFSTNDILNLMSDHSNREFIFQQVVCFIDDSTVKTFSYKQPGQILFEARGNGVSHDNIFSFDNKLTLSEMRERNMRMVNDEAFWKEFAGWLRQNKKI